MNSSEVRGTSVKLPSKWNIRLMRLKKLMNTLVFGSHLNKKDSGYRFFGFWNILHRGAIDLLTKRPKKIWPIFWATQVTILARFWGWRCELA